MNTTTPLPTLPQTELDTLIREGETLLDGEIHVTFTEEDQSGASSYQDVHGCLLCTALKRMGYRKHTVGPDYARIDGTKWHFEFGSDAAPHHFYHGQSLVGKTLVLKKQE